MTEQPQAQRTFDAVLADAIRVLTEAVHRRNRWVTPDGVQHDEPADWAEFVSLAVAGAAANAGGIEVALAGRSGSWEAAGVRQLLQGVFGEGDIEDLLRYRTSPLILRIDPSHYLDAALMRAYDADRRVLQARIVPEPPEDAGDEAYQAWEEASYALSDLETSLDDQEEADEIAYGEALIAHVREYVARVAPSVTVEATVDRNLPYPPPTRDPLGEWLLELAVEAVPQPSLTPTPLERLERPTS